MASSLFVFCLPVKGFISSIKSFKKYNANISTKNIFLNEIKTSTANIEILSKLLNKKSFIQIEDFIKQELS